MNILLMNSFYYPNMPGGAEHSVKNICESLVMLGHRVSVLCIDEIDKKETINGVDVYRMENINIKNAIEYKKSNTKIQKIAYRGLDLHGYLNKTKINKILDKINPDIVHINNIPGLGLNIFSILKEKNIPIVFTARDYYSVCMNSTLINSKGNICEKKKSLCKIYDKINKKYISKANCITSPSEFTLNLIKDSLKNSDIEYKCINNSIDIQEHYINEVFNEKKINLNRKKTLDLVFLGQLEEYKGILLLIEYIRKIDSINIRLNIAGDGSLSKDIKMIKDKRIVYHGKLNNTELDVLLKKMDIMIAPSLWYEPFGRIVIDAYKYSMPVISTGMGGLRELIKDNKTGYITDFKDINKFKEILERYKDKDILLKQMINCKKEALKYSNSKIVREYENLYKNIINNNKKI